MENSEIYVIDYNAGTNARGALFLLDEAGQRTLVSDFGDASHGPLGVDPFAIAYDGTHLVVADQRAGTDCVGFGNGCGALFRVDPDTGARVLVTDFGDASGPVAGLLFGVAVEADGSYLVSDQGRGLLFRVDPADGSRTVLSNFLDAAQGPLGNRPSGLGVEGTRRIVVAEAFPVPRLFGVDPDDGVRGVVSDFTSAAQGPLGELPIKAEPGTFPAVWVLDQVTSGLAVGDGRLFQVDSQTGARILVSDFTNAAQGPLGFNVSDLRVYENGLLLVMDFDAGTGSLGGLFLIDPVTGQRTMLSDFGNASQGPLGDEPCGVVYVPPPPPPPGQVTLTVTKSGTGTGHVSSSPAGIDCGADCVEDYPLDQEVTLFAAADADSEFIGWGGDPDCADGTVRLEASKTCDAEFRRTIVRRGFVGRDLKWYGCEPGFSGRPAACDGGPWAPNPSDPHSEFIYDIFLPTAIPFVYKVHSSGILPPPPDPVRFHVYLSSDRQLSGDDARVGEATARFLLGSSHARRGICLGEGCAPVIPNVAPGKYYLLTVIDPLNEIQELNENNNVEVFEYWICSLEAARAGNVCPD